MNNRVIHIWGIKFNPWTKAEIVDRMLRLIDEGETGIHLTGVNPETIVDAQKYPELKQAINDSDIVNVDNMFVTMALRLLGYPIPERAATPDIFEMLLKKAHEKHQTIYFLGAEKDVLDHMVATVQTEYSGLTIIGQHDGYYALEREPEIVDEIALLAPTYLFLGLPSPRKEAFIQAYKSRLNAAVCYGIGGAFDVKGGKVRRAPAWVCKIGLEGLIRILQNPRNYGKRIFKYYPSFVKAVLKEFFKKR